MYDCWKFFTKKIKIVYCDKTNIDMKKSILTKNAPLPIGPYNQAILFDNFLFVSGQIPLDPKSEKLVESGIKDETNQVMININEILKNKFCLLKSNQEQSTL